jgi:hypothetical protein
MNAQLQMEAELLYYSQDDKGTVCVASVSGFLAMPAAVQTTKRTATAG